MNKLKKIFKAIANIIKTPSLLNLVIDNELTWKKYLLKKHPSKIQLPNVDIREFLKLENNLNTFSFLGGGSLPTDILLLKNICANISDCSYFEIGTWRGESVINVSETAKECYTLNLSKKEIKDLNLPEKYSDLHGFYSKRKENINHLFGNSLTYDFGSLNKKFDVIFIDGNHKYDFVKNDTQKVFDHLVHQNSIVIWHDYALHPEQVRSDVLAGILDGIPEKHKENLYHVSNTLCAIYYPKKIKSKISDFPLKPDKNFKVSIKINA